MTTDELQKREAAFRAVSTQLEEVRASRNAGVLEALAEGWTHAQISEATGLSRGRIGQIKP